MQFKMDTEVNDYLKFLSRNVSELKQLGREWGMSDAEISSCIDRALEDVTGAPSSGVLKSTGRKIWSFIRLSLKIWFWLIVGLIVLSFGAFVVMELNPSVSLYVEKIIQPYGYDISRGIRLLTLPIHDFMSVSHLHDAECIIGNPYYREPEVDCNHCLKLGKKGVPVMKNVNQSLLEKFWNKRLPVCIRHARDKNVTYDDLKEMYINNKDVLERDVHNLESTQTFVRTLEDLFEDSTMKDKINSTSSTVIKWVLRGVQTSMVLRKLFPRLSFVPLDTEIGLEKTIFIDGPTTEHYDIAQTVLPMSFYIQGSGQRKAVLMPAPSCQRKCEVMTIYLRGGDVLTYEALYWKVYLLPNLRGISVGYSGSFSLPHDVFEEEPEKEDGEKIHEPEIFQWDPMSSDTNTSTSEDTNSKSETDQQSTMMEGNEGETTDELTNKPSVKMEDEKPTEMKDKGIERPEEGKNDAKMKESNKE